MTNNYLAVCDSITGQFDPSLVRLGVKGIKTDFRTLQARNYITIVSPPPVSVDYLSKVPTNPVYVNNSLGDCTVAGAGHCQNVWTFQATGTELILPDSAIIAAYSAVSGYVPGDPSTDNGAYLLDVLNYWRKTGIGDHKIAAYVQFDVGNHDMIKQGVNLFESLYIGINLPVSAQKQTGLGKVWDVGSTPGGWGGHCVNIPRYDGDRLYCETWGFTQQMTWPFWDEYVGECYGVVSMDMIGFNGKNPLGLDMECLLEDLAAVAQNVPTPHPPNTDPTNLIAAVKAAAEKVPYFPINDKAALFQYAIAHNLGYPESDEFELTYNGVTYVAQQFSISYLYCVKGNSDDIKVILK